MMATDIRVINKNEAEAAAAAKAAKNARQTATNDA